MNTNQLKRFAKDARIKLLDQVGRKLEFVIANTDQVFIDTYNSQINSLNLKIKQIGQDQVIEMVAYTWFNRLMALRFMDANGYTVPKVVTPLSGMSNPEILQNALGGNIEPELHLDHQRLNNLLDGRTASADAHTEAYKMLLIASCNQWHKAMPFMFERISDYTELLLPDDLLSDYSIVADIRNGMSEEDCQQEEILGWLYQFYISDENEKLIQSKKTYTKSEIAPATQLFTPKWIVKYMVDNTLGQLWSEINPSTTILKQLEFYIKPNNKDMLTHRPTKRIEEINFFDPCVGSAHILSYAFDVFYLMYEEQGYNVSSIPELIIKNNLFGIDIDERAAQIASFVLIMKGRRKNSRFLRKNIIPNIIYCQDFANDPKFNNAKVLGSLIKVNPKEVDTIKIVEGSVFADNQRELKKIYTFLGQRYDCVVTNPPYLSSGRMEASLKQYVEGKYSDFKSDLFSVFLIRCIELSNKDGLIGFICPYVWMFISSYENLRDFVINKTTISTLVQLEYNAFGPAVVPICSFTLRKELLLNYLGSYIKLSSFKGIENQEPRTLEAIKNPDCGYSYSANQTDFCKIPGSALGYWISNTVIDLFKSGDNFENISTPRQGLATTDNSLFTRVWHELSFFNIGLGLSREEAIHSHYKWFPFNKGGVFRRWYGNNDFFVNWANNGAEIKDNILRKYTYLKTPDFVAKNQILYFKKGYSWSAISNVNFGVRLQLQGTIFSNAGMALFPKKWDNFLAAALNSRLIFEMLEVLSPTMNFNAGVISILPLPLKINDILINEINLKVEECIKISKEDWESYDTSIGFSRSPLFNNSRLKIADACSDYQVYWQDKISLLNELEKDLDLLVNKAYGYIKDKFEIYDRPITIQQNHFDNDTFNLIELIDQFFSYTICCLFGRYSLDKTGLILANQGETIQDYLKQVPKPTFMPDEDNIIPVLEGEWFSDDVVGRFKIFLKAAFGEEHFEENLKYIEDTIGKDIRKYFVKDFYNNHIKRYKKRPIYWMFSSPKGHFKALIYMHRYQPDLCSKLLNDYLQAYIGKLEAAKNDQTRLSLREDISAREKTIAIKEVDKYEAMLKDCRQYERTLFDIATQKITIDLDDGVKVNYQKFKEVLVPIKGLEKEEE